LITVERKGTDPDVPTWCPDWRTTSNGEDKDLWVQSRSWKFNAGPSDGAIVGNRDPDRVLTLKGVHVDVVSGTASPLSQQDELVPRLEEFDQMVSELRASYVGGGTVEEAFWRTMLNDALELEPNRHRQLEVEDRRFFDWWRQILRDGYMQVLRSVILPELDPVTRISAAESPMEFYQQKFTIVGRSFWLPNDNRVFFTTRQGYMGFGPPDMKQGDSVAVLLGSSMPFILRQIPSPPPTIVGRSEGNHIRTYYSMVGYCYLHGIMQGEAVAENKIGNICEINII
jgi:hypothetical protein